MGELILRLRGTNSASVRDIVDLRKFVQAEIKKLDHRAVVRSQTALFASQKSSTNSGLHVPISPITRCAGSMSKAHGHPEPFPAVIEKDENRNSSCTVDSIESPAMVNEVDLEVHLDDASRAKNDQSNSARNGSKSADSIQVEISAHTPSSVSPTKCDENVENLRIDTLRFETLRAETFQTISETHKLDLQENTHSHKLVSSRTTPKASSDHTPQVSDFETKGMLGPLATSSFRRYAEAKFQRLLTELEEHYEAAIAELRPGNHLEKPVSLR